MASKNNHADEYLLIIIFLCAGLLIGLYWLTVHFHDEIMAFYVKMKICMTYPFGFLSDSWNRANELLTNGKADLRHLSFTEAAKFYNLFLLPVVIPIMIWGNIRIFRRLTEDRLKRKHSPQSLLETTARTFSSAAPWVFRDVSKSGWNRGQMRLAESPLMFLVRNRAILDENGDPFKLNQVYDCGDTPELYADFESDKENNDCDINFEALSFDTSVGYDEKSNKSFKLPERFVGTVESEIKKFDESALVSDTNSVYLNTKKRKVINSLDESKLNDVLSKHVGERMVDDKGKMYDDPFDYFRKYENDPKNRWRLGLAVALFLHGFSDKSKSVAWKILDCMNYSLYNDKPMAPELIDIGDAAKEKTVWRSDESFKKLVKIHSLFENTFFMGLLRYAKGRGVIIPANFGWVRCFDRTLWLSFQQVGKSVCYAEAAGAWSHYHAEEAFQKAIDIPYLEIAIEGFREEMITEGYLNAEHEMEIKKQKELYVQKLLDDAERAKEAGY